MDHTLQAYYTESRHIVDCMLQLVSIKESSRVLEPCAGHGSFVSGILAAGKFKQLDLFEINTNECAYLNEKYAGHNVSVTCSDFLLDPDLRFKCDMGGFYDVIIANPPYGAYQDFAKRKILKKIFRGLYVKETYSLFLYRSIELLRPDGELVFIIPDTFLSLHRHNGIRSKILRDTEIQSIRVFPSNFFPNVNFGYSNLCILKLRKVDRQRRANEIAIFNSYRSVSQLTRVHVASFFIPVKAVIDSDDLAIIVSDDLAAVALINSSERTIDDVAFCVTGFYSGNDKIYLKSSSSNVKYSKRYSTVNFNDVYTVPSGAEQSHGIDASAAYVPIVKGGNTRFYKPNEWFMDWSSRTVQTYKTHKKSRYQNSEYYFKDGIAVPMVSSTKISASLIDHRLFDQSIVGVFPKDKQYLLYLLGFFNSEICNKLLRLINPTANNSANYIKRIPFVDPGPLLTVITDHVSRLVDQSKNGNCVSQTDIALLDKLYAAVYNHEQTECV